MGLFGTIGSILGAGKAKSASKKAEAAQLDYLNKALDYTKQQDATTQGYLEPYREAGTACAGGIVQNGFIIAETTVDLAQMNFVSTTTASKASRLLAPIRSSHNSIIAPDIWGKV